MDMTIQKQKILRVFKVLEIQHPVPKSRKGWHKCLNEFFLDSHRIKCIESESANRLIKKKLFMFY